MRPRRTPGAGRVDEACPICHAGIEEGASIERVPVCPVIYPRVTGLACHPACLATERERTRYLMPGDLRPSLLEGLSRLVAGWVGRR